MPQAKLIPVDSTYNLRARVERLLKSRKPVTSFGGQLSFDGLDISSSEVINIKQNIYEFLDFISDVVPSGDVYLFGGVIRDLALFGGKGFDSDIDLVVDGDWSGFDSYLSHLGAKKNKFGGFRLNVGNWPVDIWSVKETWAFRTGKVEYKDVASLIETTVLNWDAILMNWRTRSFIYKERYFEDIRNGLLDVVLLSNPNPLGMAVRVFRHLYIKEARKITKKAALYLSRCANMYSFEEIKQSEINSYRNSYITEPLFLYFKLMSQDGGDELSGCTKEIGEIIKKQYSFC